MSSDAGPGISNSQERKASGEKRTKFIKSAAAIVAALMLGSWIPYASKSFREAETDRVESVDISDNLRDGVIAIVNNEEVSARELEIFAKRNGLSISPESRDAYLNIVAISQEASNNDVITSQDNVEAVLKYQKRRTLYDAYVSHAANTFSADEVEIKKIYEQIVKNQKSFAKYKVLYNLSNTREEAERIVTELAKKDNDEVLKRFKSFEEEADGSESKNGKENRGWMKLSEMPYLLGNIVRQMEKGDFTRSPLVTRNGFMVVFVSDYKEGDPPAFEEIKEAIKTELLKQHISDITREARMNSQIRIR